MRISDWSSDVCSSDLPPLPPTMIGALPPPPDISGSGGSGTGAGWFITVTVAGGHSATGGLGTVFERWTTLSLETSLVGRWRTLSLLGDASASERSEEHTSESSH